jgi:hypothetical protein
VHARANVAADFYIVEIQLVRSPRKWALAVLLQQQSVAMCRYTGMTPA